MRARAPMDERSRLLALLEIYDDAIEELYVLDDRDLMDLILRLERRRQGTARLLDKVKGNGAARVSGWVASEIEPARALRPHGVRDLLGAKDSRRLPSSPSFARPSSAGDAARQSHAKSG